MDAQRELMRDVHKRLLQARHTVQGQAGAELNTAFPPLAQLPRVGSERTSAEVIAFEASRSAELPPTTKEGLLTVAHALKAARPG